MKLCLSMGFKEKIFITDDCEEIIPHWLRFIPGVVDSQDISLNISREMLQNNPIITKIKKGITTKILNEITIFSSKEVDTYLKFWNNFGAVIKEGLYEFNDHHDKILLLHANIDWVKRSLTIFHSIMLDQVSDNI